MWSHPSNNQSRKRKLSRLSRPVRPRWVRPPPPSPAPASVLPTTDPCPAHRLHPQDPHALTCTAGCWLLAALLLNVLYVRIHLSSLAGDEAMAMAQRPAASSHQQREASQLGWTQADRSSDSVKQRGLPSERQEQFRRALLADRESGGF
jgi:hypothetical protein